MGSFIFVCPEDVCKGCGRKEIHKLCPAYGTPIYMHPEHPEWGNATDERLTELRGIDTENKEDS
jgi:hypothetical protein